MTRAPVDFANWPYPRHIAHRGAGKLAPENTLAAFRHGASFGYRMFEFDVKLSADGKPVLMHDATLDRTTSGSGRVDALTLGELAALDAGSWHSPAYAGEPVPTLAAVARYTQANGCFVNIEIKPVPGNEYRTGAAVALDALALWQDAAVPPLLSSFSEVALEAARLAAPGLPRALLLDRLPADCSTGCAGSIASRSMPITANSMPTSSGRRMRPASRCCAIRSTSPRVPTICSAGAWTA